MKEPRAMKSRTSRGKKAAIITVGILSLIVIVIFGIQLWIKSEIRRALETPIEIGETTLDVKAGGIRVNLLGRSASLKEAVVQTVPGGNGVQSESTPTLIATADKVKISGIKYRKGKQGRKPMLGASRISLVAPSITYAGNNNQKEDNEGKGFSIDSIRAKIFEQFRELSIGQITVSQANLDISTWGSQGESQYLIDNLDLDIRDIEFNEEEQPSLNLIFCNRILASAEEFVYTYKDGALKMHIKKPDINTSEQSLSLEEFALVPQYAKNEYAQRVFDHSDWTEITLTSLSAYRLDYSLLLTDNLLSAESASIGGGSVASYKNKQVPQERKVKPLLYEGVQKLKLGIDIPKITAQGIYAQYDELSESGKEPGVIFFTDIAATFSGMTNRPSSDNQTYKMDASGMLMGKARTDVEMSIPASAAYDHFELSSKVGQMEMADMNAVFTPLSNIQITSGTMTGLEFSMVGSSIESATDAVLTYEDMKIELLRGSDGSEKKFISLLANGIMKSNNPDKNGLRKGEGTFERDPYRSHFNYMWRSVFTAVTKIVI